MAVCESCVHATGVLRGEGFAAVLLDGKRVHVGPQGHNGFGTRVVADEAANGPAAVFACVGHTDLFKARTHKCDGFVKVETRFGMGVDVSARGDGFFKQRFSD